MQAVSIFDIFLRNETIQNSSLESFNVDMLQYNFDIQLKCSFHQVTPASYFLN